MTSRWLLSAAVTAAALTGAALPSQRECSSLVKPDGEEICSEFSPESLYGTRRLCPSDLVPTPEWEGPAVSDPPLDDQAARDISREALVRMGLQLDEWKLFATQIEQHCRGRWYFRVIWVPRERHPGTFYLVINMDGRPLVNSHLADGSDGEEGAAADFERNKCAEGEIPTTRGCATLPRRISPAHVPYPEAARKAGVGGRVILLFTVLKDGTIKDPEVTMEKPEGYGFGEAALEFLAASTWKPAHQKGDPFDHRMSHSINWKPK